MIKAEVLGGNAVIAKLENYPVAFQNRLERVIKRLAVDLQIYIKAHKLSGQVLKNRSGTLRRSVNQQVKKTGNDVIATVGANTPYAGRHEFGFTGTENVKAFIRNVKGKPQSVKGFSRHINYPAHSYMRTGLADMKDEILASMKTAIKDPK